MKIGLRITIFEVVSLCQFSLQIGLVVLEDLVLKIM